jgi:hypothetical protein
VFACGKKNMFSKSCKQMEQFDNGFFDCDNSESDSGDIDDTDIGNPVKKRRLDFQLLGEYWQLKIDNLQHCNESLSSEQNVLLNGYRQALIKAEKTATELFLAEEKTPPKGDLFNFFFDTVII